MIALDHAEYRDLYDAMASCPAPGAPGTILGFPACVYRLAMYAVLAILSGWALVRTDPSRVAGTTR